MSLAFPGVLHSWMEPQVQRGAPDLDAQQAEVADDIVECEEKARHLVEGRIETQMEPQRRDLYDEYSNYLVTGS